MSTTVTDLASPTDAVARTALHFSNALEAERRRIAAVLHDDVGQTLAAACMRLHEVGQATDDAKRSELIDKVDELMRRAIEATRCATRALRPAMMAEEAFPSVLVEEGSRFAADHRIPCSVRSDPPHIDVEAEVADAVLRVVRELLHNVAKHASAGAVRIDVAKNGDDLEVVVADDGAGFDPATPVDGFGLLIARERLAELGGELDVRSGADGTTIVLRIPAPVTSGGDAP